jgi:glycosyltransferase involved in cell wall biosynthesis
MPAGWMLATLGAQNRLSSPPTLRLHWPCAVLMPTVTGLVSALIIAYNQERFIRETVASVQAQTYNPLEIIVADDASTDATPDIVRAIARNDPRIQLLRAPQNGGITANCNLALSAARGEFAAWLGGDDLWLPSKIEKQVRVFASHPEISLVGTDVDVFFEDESPSYVARCPIMQRGGSLADFVRARNHIPTSSFMYRRGAMPDLTCDPRLRVVSDWLFNVECAARGGLGYVPEVLTRYRRWPGNVTAAGPHRAFLDDRLISTDILVEKYPDLCPAAMVARMNMFLQAGLRHLRESDFVASRPYFRAACRQRPADVRPRLLLAFSHLRLNPYVSDGLRAAGRRAIHVLFGG